MFSQRPVQCSVSLVNAITLLTLVLYTSDKLTSNRDTTSCTRRISKPTEYKLAANESAILHASEHVTTRKCFRHRAIGKNTVQHCIHRTLSCARLHMHITAGKRHVLAFTSASPAIRSRSRSHLRKGFKSCAPVRSTLPTRAVFHPLTGKQIANIMTV